MFPNTFSACSHERKPRHHSGRFHGLSPHHDLAKAGRPGSDSKVGHESTDRESVPTVRVELEIPAGVVISSFEAKAGWQIEQKKDASGTVTAAIWSGSTIKPNESAEFAFVGRNPGSETKLVWKVVQIYEDRTRSEWTGAEGSRSPAPVTTISKQ